MNRNHLSAIMANAWILAREGASRFGGSVKSYFACALKMAWVEEKSLQVRQETSVTIWHKGFGNQFVLAGVPISRPVSKKGQYGLPGIGV